VKTRSLYLTSS